MEKTRGLLVINGYYRTSVQEALYTEITDAFNAEGISVLLKTNTEFTIFLPNEAEKPNFDFAIFLDKDVLLAKTLERAGVRCFNSSSAIEIADDKLLTHFHLACAGLPMPKTIAAPFTYSNIGYNNYDFLLRPPTASGTPPYSRGELEEQASQFPPACRGEGHEVEGGLVVKASKGSLGEQVFLARNFEGAKAAVQKIYPVRAVLQEFIEESAGTDIRVFVVGGKAVGAIKRVGKPGDFRSNSGLGGTGEAFDAPPEYLKLAEEAAKAIGADFAGVDILPSNRGPLVCEINTSPFFATFKKITGINPAKVIAEYVKKLNT